MNVDELIVELQKQQAKGYGKLKVKYDYGACEILSVLHEKDDSGSDEYIRLDDITWD